MAVSLTEHTQASADDSGPNAESTKCERLKKMFEFSTFLENFGLWLDTSLDFL